MSYSIDKENYFYVRTENGLIVDYVDFETIKDAKNCVKKNRKLYDNESMFICDNSTFCQYLYFDKLKKNIKEYEM